MNGSVAVTRHRRLAIIDVSIYLAAYFVRLRFMSRLAKSDDPNASRRYFVEEQIVATPALVVTLAALALWGHGAFMHELRDGFTSFWGRPVVGTAIVIGLLSQGTGVFGGLILLDRRENSYCVPVNRSSSILAGLVASLFLSVAYGLVQPSTYELVGAGLIIAAILALTLPSFLPPRRA